MNSRRAGRALGALAATSAALAIPLTSAQAYDPTGGTLYQLGSEPCLKGRGNCAVYPKSAQLPGGRLVASFEKSTVVPATGSADQQTLPVYKSDDHGTTWQPLSEVKAPAELSGDAEYAKYTSNWTNPYLYVLPQDVGDLKQGTLLLASVVSGDDYYYKEHKAVDTTWTPSNDGDRKDLAIALYSSTDDGATWRLVNVVATGGWQGGSAGAVGRNIADANTDKQVDPLWEPYLMVHKGRLVCCYSDENDYTGFNASTGVPVLDPANGTAPDSHGQILVHKTWDGRSSAWSEPVVDIAGLTQDMGGAKTEIGGDRPGMTNVVRTTDGKWMITYEYWGGGVDTRYRIADDPLKFYTGSPTGTGVDGLPRDAGSRALAAGGSPVVIRLPGGRLVYNAAGSGNGDVPDVRLEAPGAAANPDTQYWHIVSEPNGGKTLLNKSGGRAAAIWTGNATAGQKIGQWVDDNKTGSWNLVKTGDGFYRLQSLKNTSLYLTGATAGGQLTLQNAVDDGSQDWELVR
ncbi:RICIN domain-containing protein [Streptomyces luteogriseus]|uniref:RICIN domain-containing protein n=1 Tax=Streptomyces luteogriseus TaxID=68233 RepID=UPI00378B2FFE